MSATVLFDRVALIGLGLIGSSLGHALKRDGLAGHVAGTARSAATREKALEIGFIDSAHETPAEAVADADLVVICAPVGANAAIAKAMAPGLKKGAIVTDVGSVKMAVIRDVGPCLPEGVHLVPGHPVAGTENSGPESGFPELYEGRYCIITPPPGADKQAVAAVVDMWKKVGSIVEIMDAEHHDRVLAITSHLPHLIAYTIVGTANDLEEHLRRESAQNGDLVRTSEVIKFSAGGFRDFTRIAASDPVMWRDVFLNNKEAVLEVLGLFSEDLSALQRAIRRGNGDVLEDWFERTRTIRRGIIDMKQAGSFSAVEPEGGLTSESPEGGLTSESPEGGLTSESPEGGLTSESPEGGLTSESPEGGLTSESPEGGLTSESPEGGLTSGSPEGGLTSELPEGGLTSESPEGESDPNPKF